MMFNPMVSIVMPVFNGELFLKQAVESVISQTHPNWELLIVDDGSTDSSYEIAQRYAKRNGKIRLFSHPGRINRGVSATRNLALENCRGKFIATLDCDDEWKPEKLEKQISIIHRYPQVILVYGLAETIDENGKTLYKRLNSRTEIMSPVSAGSGLPGGPYSVFGLLVRGKIWVPSPTALAPTDAVRECRGFDETLKYQVEDHLLFTVLAEHGSVYFINEVLSRYRVHSNTWTAELDHRKKSRAYMQYCDRLIHKVKKENIPLVSREYVDKWIKLAAQGGFKYVIKNPVQILVSQLRLLLNSRVLFRDKFRCLWLPPGILLRKLSHFFRIRVVNPILSIYYLFKIKKINQTRYPPINIHLVKDDSRTFLADMSLVQTGNYGFDKNRRIPTLYSSIYAVLLFHLYGDLNELSAEKKKEWSRYLLNFQGEDGLFRDPELSNSDAELGDSWGWRHLSVHALAALDALNCRTKYPFAITEFLMKPGNATQWLLSLNWTDHAANTSNMVMNYGVFLQYNRDFWKVKEAGNVLQEIFEFLDKIQNTDNGLWGGPFPKTKNGLSLMQQTAYHLWLLYFYDNRPVQYITQAIDSCLELQNKLGGFGPGHSLKSNPNPFTSACEDIDCIDPLSRFYFLIDYRRNDIQAALKKALYWVLANQNRDGGFVFRKKELFFYGHENMYSKRNQSNMFATWFRNLSIAYISQVVSKERLFNESTYHFLNCPGYQFWKIPG